MNRMARRRWLIPIAIAVLSIAASPLGATAHDPAAAGTPPASGTRVGSGTGFSGRDAFTGSNVSEDYCVPNGSASATSSQAGPSAQAASPPPEVQCPANYAFLPHRHTWIRTTGTYYGYYYYNSQRSCVGPCSLGYTETRSLSNSWGASIGFSSKAVSGGLKFDVSWSESYSYSVTLNNSSPGVNKQLRFKDGYYVSNGNVKTDHFYDTFYFWYCCTSTGTGWGAKFDNRTFYLQTI